MVNVACIGEIRHAHKMLVRRPVGRSLVRPRQKWEGIRIDLRETVCKEVEWVQLAQGSNQLWSVGRIETPDFHKEFLDHCVQLNWLATLLKCTLMLQPDTFNCFCNTSVLKITF